MSGYDYNPQTAGGMIPRTYPTQNVVDQINAILGGGAAGGQQVQQQSSSSGGYAGSGISTMNPYNPQDANAAAAQMNAINAAGPDVWDRAMGTVRDQRRGMLDAIAAAGSAGKAEYQRMTQQSATNQQAQIAQMLASAQAHGAPAATIAGSQAAIEAPFTNAQSDRDAANANWQNLFNALGVSYGGYYDKWGNTLPILQQQFKNDLATNFATTRAGAMADIEKGRQSTDLQMAQIQLAARQRAEDQAIQAAQDAENRRRWELEFAEANRDDQRDFDEDVRRFGLQYALDQQKLRLAASSGGGGGGGGGGGFGGTGMTQTQFKAAVPSAITGFRQAIDPRGITGSTFAKITGVDKLMNQVAGHNIGLQNNISDALMASVMPKYNAGLTNVTPTAPAPRIAAMKAQFTPAQTAVYNGARADAANGLRAGFSPNDVFLALTQKYGDSAEKATAIQLAIEELQMQSGASQFRTGWAR